MAKIFFSMSGEGRGHATRVRAMVEPLREAGHEIWLFTPGAAHELLAPVYENSNVRVVHIDGLRFHYTPDGRLNYLRTVRAAGAYFAGFSKLKQRLINTIRREKPDLVVTDFEPALPRAARHCGVPFLSVNHQHFLLVNDLSALPVRLRMHAWYMSWVVRSYYSGQAATVISQFYFPPVKKQFRDSVVQAGCLLRPEILRAEPSNGGHLVAYLRKFASKQVIDALKECSSREVRLYGLGRRQRDDNIMYCEIDDRRFIEDLATCEALICTAGNQLVGEALYLGKPVFAMPEHGNYEQYINAFYLEESGAGMWTELDRVGRREICAFIDNIEDYRLRINRERMNGTTVALDTINKYISEIQENRRGSVSQRTAAV